MMLIGEARVEQAQEIDRHPPDPKAKRVRLDAEVSSTTAVHARGALLQTVRRIEQEGEEMWITWPLLCMVGVIDEALGDR